MKDIFELLKQLNKQGVQLVVNDGRLSVSAKKGKISSDLLGHVKQYKQQLIDILSSSDSISDIPRVEHKDATVLSYAQSRLWFIDQLNGGSPEYNIAQCFKVKGTLDIGLIETVLQDIVHRHEILRTCYQNQQGEAILEMKSAKDFTVNRQFITSSDELDSTLVELNNYVFDLANDFMLKVDFISASGGVNYLLFNIHHIASDGWSLEVLCKEFFSLYSAYTQKQENPLPELPIQYSDYAHWLHSEDQSTEIKKQLDYWKEHLHDAPHVHNLPLDRHRDKSRKRIVDVVNSSLPAKYSTALENIAKRYKLSNFMLLHAMFALLISRYSHQKNIVIGTPVTGRNHSSIDALIGCFASKLVLNVNTEFTLLEPYLEHVRQVHLKAQANQDVPFEQIVDALGVERSSAYAPLVQINLTTSNDFGVSEKSDQDSFKVADAVLTAHTVGSGIAKSELEVKLSISDKGIALQWAFDSSLFNVETVEQYDTHLTNLLQSLADSEINDRTQVSKLNMLSISDYDELSSLTRQDLGLSDDAFKLLYRQFEMTARHTPEKIAVHFAEQSITYGELNKRANQVAHSLKAQNGIEQNPLVGLYTHKSIDMVVGLLGIWKAGGAYVPLDPKNPSSRTAHIIKDAKLSLILVSGNECENLPSYEGVLLSLDGLGDISTQDYFCSAYSYEDLLIESTQDDLAYVIYTSGSTGTPKGVMVEHGALSSFDSAFAQQLALCSTQNIESWVWCSSIAFDASLKSLSLLSRGRVIVLPSELEMAEPREFKTLLTAHKIQVLNATPQLLSNLLDIEDMPSLDIISSGEAISADAFLQFQKFTARHNTTFINAYGPTECTVNCSFGVNSDAQKQHIGQASTNVSHYVLSYDGSCAPKGSIGELYISGDGLAR
ncbi:hypothetical protein CWB97_07765, partial [Pseudoalteromonas citrea]